ncbi:hypothetical protein ADU37_CDS18360 [Thermococcus sp. 2319x1]|uniref:hypothetical protein n=1 Tax=Thermococcus sp. 2319x1 TaxID=1674923 RepID=UPI00073A7F5A|nr:hypothetical protein [Thermococcus sp. 2319x1]ALV63535.1 hypothetical protein ADU37_CDS18360 [Thermococcus sp. 2319x1]
MEARVCKFCAGEKLNDVVKLLEDKGFKVSVEGCIGLCAKYGCGNINVIAGEKEISVGSFEEFIKALEG